MTVNVKFTLEELRLLTTLAADQMFRREFIDPKMPGYKADRSELLLGKALVARLRSMTERGTDKDNPAPRMVGKTSARTAAAAAAPKVEADAV